MLMWKGMRVAMGCLMFVLFLDMKACEVQWKCCRNSSDLLPALITEGLIEIFPVSMWLSGAACWLALCWPLEGLEVVSSFSWCLTLSAWDTTAAALSIENLGDGRALFLYRLDYISYLYSVFIGVLVLKEGTLIQCLCQPKGLTKILP